MIVLSLLCLAMLRREPIVTWTTLYHAFVYGLLFLLLEVSSLSNESLILFLICRHIHLSTSHTTPCLVKRLAWYSLRRGLAISLAFLSTSVFSNPSTKPSSMQSWSNLAEKERSHQKGVFRVSHFRRSSPPLACSGLRFPPTQTSTGLSRFCRVSQWAWG